MSKSTVWYKVTVSPENYTYFWTENTNNFEISQAH